MATKPKMVRGTYSNGAVIEVTEEKAERLGAAFTPEGAKTAAKKTAAKKTAAPETKPETSEN